MGLIIPFLPLVVLRSNSPAETRQILPDADFNMASRADAAAGILAAGKGWATLKGEGWRGCRRNRAVTVHQPSARPRSRVALLRLAADSAFLAGTLDGVLLNGVDPATGPIRAGALRDRLSGSPVRGRRRRGGNGRCRPSGPARRRRSASSSCLPHGTPRRAARRDAAVAMARVVGAPVEECRALATLRAVHGRRGDLAEVTACFERATALAEEAGAVEVLFRAHGNLVASLGALGR